LDFQLSTSTSWPCYRTRTPNALNEPNKLNRFTQINPEDSTQFLHERPLNCAPDKRILECASKAEAELLVTGDTHLLELEEYGNCKIVKLSPFLTMLQQTPTGQQFPSSKPEK
jgi:predicted nucleic acid-binding protein